MNNNGELLSSKHITLLPLFFYPKDQMYMMCKLQLVCGYKTKNIYIFSSSVLGTSIKKRTDLEFQVKKQNITVHWALVNNHLPLFTSWLKKSICPKNDNVNNFVTPEQFIRYQQDPNYL